MKEINKKTSFNIIANAVWGYHGLSGGDNIFINFGNQLQKYGFKINVFTWKHGYLMSKKNGLKNANYFLSEAGKFEKWPFLILYFVRTWYGIKKVKQKVNHGLFKNGETIVYSASDFIPDFLPALIFKKLVPNSFWIAGFYLFAPNPFKGFRGSFQKKIKFPDFWETLFWLSQKIIFKIIVKQADLICVTSQPDIAPFVIAGRKPEEIFVVKGGIDYFHLSKFQKPVEKIYDAVYVGRFHSQKGVVEMIDIWKKVVEKKPRAILAVIGLGSMEREMRNKVKIYSLEKNVRFLGVKRGDDRNKVLQKSKIILHPSVYDSGGMAAASGLACGLPGLCFNLPVFKTYYPKGFLRAEIGNIDDFADKIRQLLDNKELYGKVKKEAIKEAESWDWGQRINEFVKIIEKEK